MTSLRSKITEGAGLLSFSMVAGRLLQLGAAAVTTRILLPAEFGLLAVAMAVTLLMDRVTAVSLGAALVQQQCFSHERLDVAWSYELVRGLVLCAIVVVAAPWLAAAFGEPNATALLRWASLSFVINGFRNAGAIRLYRDLDFRALCFLDLVPVAAYAFAAVVATWWLQSVWGLVLAGILGSVVGVAASYAVHPHWPQVNFSWRVARPMFVFSSFLLGNAMLQTLREQGLVFLLSRRLPLTDLGYYNRASSFSLALFTQAWTMVWRLSYPAFAQLQGQPERLRNAWLRSTRWLCLASPLGVILFILAAPWFVREILGPGWLPIVPLMQAFGAYAALWFIAAPSEVVFQAVGRPALGTRLNLMTTGIVLVSAYHLIGHFGLPGAAWAFLLGQACVTPFVLLMCWRLLAATHAPPAQPSPSAAGTPA